MKHPRSKFSAFCTGGAFLLAVLLSSCSLLTDWDVPGGRRGVIVTSSPPYLEITNHTRKPVYTFAVGRQIAPLINWAHHIHGEGLRPGLTERLHYDDILMEDGEVEAIVYWWYAVEKDGQRVPGPVNWIVADL